MFIYAYFAIYVMNDENFVLLVGGLIILAISIFAFSMFSLFDVFDDPTTERIERAKAMLNETNETWQDIKEKMDDEREKMLETRTKMEEQRTKMHESTEILDEDREKMDIYREKMSEHYDKLQDYRDMISEKIGKKDMKETREETIDRIKEKRNEILNKNIDFEGNVIITLLEYDDDINDSQTLMNRVAFLLAIDDFNRYLEENTYVSWRIIPDIRQYQNHPAIGMHNSLLEGEKYLKSLGMDINYQILSILPIHHIDDKLNDYVISSDSIVIGMCKNIGIELDDSIIMLDFDDNAYHSNKRIADFIKNVDGHKHNHSSLTAYNGVILYGYAILQSGSINVDNIKAEIYNISLYGDKDGERISLC